jgi:hypothetical protein
MDLITEPPWEPVAPKTTMIFFPVEAIVSLWWVW